MSEHDFELYLSLLSRLLRLDPAQREQIADELRDHLEERLNQLTGQGHSRSEAIRQALDEFGDAAGLAARFSHIANRRKRRLIMRYTLGSIGAAVAAILLAMALWPENARVQVPNRAVAQQPAARGPAAAEKPAAGRGRSAAENRQAEVEAKLDTRLEKVDFEDSPIADVLVYIGDTTDLDVLVDQAYFDAQGLTMEAPITLHVEHTKISARTALELALEQLGNFNVGFTIRDGLVYVSEKHRDHELRVYNCRDLMQAGFGGAFGPAGGGAPGPFVAGGEGGMPTGMGGGGFGVAGEGRTQSALVAVIETTIHPQTWAPMGGAGSVTEFNGLLIVKHSQSVQREIKQLLDLMRAAAAEQNPGGSETP